MALRFRRPTDFTSILSVQPSDWNITQVQGILTRYLYVVKEERDFQLVESGLVNIWLILKKV